MKKTPIEITDTVFIRYKATQAKALNQLLENILKRKPTEEDYKKVEFGTIQGREGEMLVKFDGSFLGRFVTKMKTENNQTKFSINFIPNNPIQTSKKLEQ